MKQTGIKEINTKAWLGEKCDLLVTVQEICIWPYQQMVCAQIRIRPRKWEKWNSREFWDINGSPNPDQKAVLILLINKKKSNSIDISSDTIAKYLTTKPAHGYEKETPREKLNLF